MNCTMLVDFGTDVLCGAAYATFCS
jgi:hypothetical protein